MIFPTEITGFFGTRDTKPGRSKRSEDERPALTNYLSLALSGESRKVIVLLNLIYPMLGFAAPGNSVRREFIDVPEAAEQFRTIGVFQVLDKAVLDEKVTDAMCADLNSSELHKMKYWEKVIRPLRVGDVVFNYWD